MTKLSASTFAGSTVTAILPSSCARVVISDVTSFSYHCSLYITATSKSIAQILFYPRDCCVRRLVTRPPCNALNIADQRLLHVCQRAAAIGKPHSHSALSLPYDHVVHIPAVLPAHISYLPPSCISHSPTPHRHPAHM
ncbi:hypothetical protein BDR06DRAFT_517929 [Suillus hirtellus]|nr:hypothetical protein BDR06DRAFT_517929 [Suillus hirtellus]